MKNYWVMSLVLLLVTIGSHALAQKSTKAAFYENPATQVMLKTNADSKTCVKAFIWKKQPKKEVVQQLYKAPNNAAAGSLGVFDSEQWQTLKRSASIWLTTRNSKGNLLANMKRGTVVPNLLLGVKCDVHPFKMQNMTVAASEIDGDIIWLRLER